MLEPFLERLGAQIMITVASVPSSHPYVRAVTAGVENVGIRMLPDPIPFAGAPSGQWWPPRWLDPGYLRDAITTIDVLHVHFGFDAATVDQLSDVVDVLRSAAVPLVLTVHDLHNPHFRDATAHRSHLDALIPAADAVVTLTHGAAREIERTWHRDAIVLPHPHVAPLDLAPAPRNSTSRPVIAVHAKSLRANLDPVAVVPTVVATARTLGAVVRIDIDDDVFDAGSHSYAPDTAARLLAYASTPDVDVRVHSRFADDDLWTYLTEIDVSVLPYRFGTHSGWMEACRDFGVRVVVPDTGYYSDQYPCESFVFGVDRLDPATLADALARSVAAPPMNTLVHNAFRNDQATELARAHSELYQRVRAEVDNVVRL